MEATTAGIREFHAGMAQIHAPRWVAVCTGRWRRGHDLL